MLPPNARTRWLNGTCDSSVDMELFLHYSLIPSLFIILVLSFLQRREQRRERDDVYLLRNRFGMVIPLDFVGTFSNRWSYGIAFGATANKVMFLFSEGYQPLLFPQWAQAFVLLIGGIEVGLSHFPFFACLSSEFGLVSSILGFSYSLIWFVVTILYIIQCPHGQFVGSYETVMFYWPSLLCLAFLLGRFLHIFAKSLRVHLGWELQTEEKPFLEAHQAEHVRQLLRTRPRQERNKSWFQTRIYEWDPYFQFPSRMIGTIVLAFICLYLFIVIEFCVFVYVRDALDVFEGELESYITSMNQTGTPALLQVKELINISKEVWVVTILPASLTCVSYLFHILACYRKHIKRLWAGDKHFLPLKFHNPSSSESVVAIARYSGWQIAYILWGYLIIHVMQSLCGLAITYSLVLPVIHHQALEMLRGLGIGMYGLPPASSCNQRWGQMTSRSPWLSTTGFSAWIGMLYVDHYHTNPVLVSFCHILITGHRQRRLQQTIKYWCLNQSAGPRISARSRTRWLLLQTLINNPELVRLRKSRPGLGSQELTQVLLTCSES
ncbi:stimulated by retinoic acid gene 6 protein-like isoform X6 [Odocoileus virginianus]|uniref:Stimulated by retinoic acid gene 6 protein-like isoform X6 n=1 Tax=Odocoileus virginianus TaxID=9874 RepID=A0A6J0YWW4_ODOVR